MTKSTDTISKLEGEIERLKSENMALLKVASHDIRSPLNKIFALVNLLKMSDKPLSEEQQGYIHNIEMVLSDALHKMRNLMDLRTIESDSVILNIESIDIGALIAKVTRDHKILATRKNLTLSPQVISLELLTDKLAITRIVDQLLSNAIKFSPTGSAIKVVLEEDQEFAKFSVIDGGYGIKEEEQVDLFRKFKVLSTHATGGESKTGLGLFIAQCNAELLGGKISYDNDVNSKFTLKIPILKLA